MKEQRQQLSEDTERRQLLRDVLLQPGSLLIQSVPNVNPEKKKKKKKPKRGINV